MKARIAQNTDAKGLNIGSQQHDQTLRPHDNFVLVPVIKQIDRQQ